ncbi:AcrR family transcriptional regulator [Actinoplanes lutulentus]|uniref:TetR family transcriptional regulator n=1 Tax=Actinoplanes lutulentus TaxID=1287878 RepID=A0A327ZFM1_9ACTN|nr:TetR/AcrR family transcriptional regulator [Actinoplanes lutulentus]MBB2941653.1 AcrR family transcriptional regulator [Actinoplanes lutulentus]RAK39573.1 TetR family transcriptional regulator [Actinoplanes lutulentus]
MGIRQQQAATTEAELKAAAIRVFARVGYLNAKIAEITAEAGRATGSFYKHFASKEKLLEALLADLLAEGDAGVGLAGHSTDFRDREAIRWHVAMYWNFHREHGTIMTALRQAAIVDAGFAQRSQEMLEPDVHHIADHLDGLDLPGDRLVMASLFTTTIAAFAENMLGRIPDDEAIETLTSFLHAGLGGPAPAQRGLKPAKTTARVRS